MLGVAVVLAKEGVWRLMLSAVAACSKVLRRKTKVLFKAQMGLQIKLVYKERVKSVILFIYVRNGVS